LVRLAGDLLDWDTARDGPLAAVWSREQLRQRRRTMAWILAAALLLCVAAVVAVVQATRSKAASQRARANAIIVSADASDPLTGALLLRELAEEGDPGDGMRVARKLAGERIASAVLRGHTGRPTAIASLPDGRVVTASVDGTVRIWPLDGRGDPAVLPGTSPVDAMAIEARGNFIAAGDKDGNVRIFSPAGKLRWQRNVGDGIESLSLAADGAAVAVVTTHSRAYHLDVRGATVTPIAIEPLRPTAVFLEDAQEGLVAMEDRTVHAFSAAAPMLSRILGAEATGPDAVTGPFSGRSTFSADGQWVATVLTSEVVLRSTHGSFNRRLVHPDSVNSVAFSPDGRFVVTACSDGKGRVWSVAGGEPEVFDPAIRYLLTNLHLQPPELKSARMKSALFSPDATRIATMTEDGVVRVWQRGSSEPPVELRRQWGKLAFSPRGDSVLVATDAGFVFVWPLAAPDEPHSLQRIASIYHAAMNSDATLIAASGSNETIASIWHPAETPAVVHALGSDVTACAISGDRIAAAHTNGLVTVHDANGRKLRDLTGATGPLKDVLLTRDGNHVFARNEREVFRWSTTDGVPSVFRGPPSEINAFAVSRDGTRLLTCLDDGLAVVWNTVNPASHVILGGPLGHRSPIYDGTLDHDGSRAWTVAKDGTGRFWRLHDDGTFETTVIDFGHPGWLHTVTLSPDETQLVITNDAGRAVLFDWRGRRQRALTAIGELAHVGPIMQAVYSDDGSRILTCSGMDGTARIWDLTGRTRPQLLDGLGGTITACGFTSDGRRAFTATEQGFVKIWTVGWRELIERSSARTSATLMVDQRIALLGETAEEARRNYEAAEKLQGRKPLPPEWSFSYSSW
jgi:WD40 repeat protein